MRIAGLPVWGPSDMIIAARAVLGWTDEAVAVVATLPARATTMLDALEALLGGLATVADDADRLLRRAETIVADIDEVLVGARGAIARTDTVLLDAEGMVRRIDPLLTEVRTVADGAAGLVEHAGEVAAGAAVLVAKAGGVADSAGGVITKADSVAQRAGSVVDQASGASRGASELLALYQPLATRAAPLARRFVEELSEAEVEAAIRLVDQVPQFTEHMETDIMPILATLDRVGPDVHELLDVLKDVRLAIQGVPGLGMLRRRGKREEAGN